MNSLKSKLRLRFNIFSSATFSLFLLILSAGLYLEIELEEQIDLIDQLTGRIKTYENFDSKVFAEDRLFIHLLLKPYPTDKQSSYTSIYQHNRDEIDRLTRELISHPFSSDSQKKLLLELSQFNNILTPVRNEMLKNNFILGFPLSTNISNDAIDANANHLALLQRIKAEQTSFISSILLLNKQQLISTLTIIEALIFSLGIAMFGAVIYHNKLRKHQAELENTVLERTSELHDNIEQLHNEIEQRESVEYKLYQMAYTDNLTGLANRRSFYERLEQALETQVLFKTGKLFLFFLDLDGFKQVNDVFGHAAGDHCLQTSSARWQAKIPDNAVLARLGGDEFALFFMADEDKLALTIANQMFDALEPTMLFDGQALDIGVSIGVANYPDHASTMKQLLWSADTAMYAAKKAGKRCIRVYDATNASV